MKYFLLGAFASAFLLYGIALIYGATGSTNLDRIAAAAAARAAATRCCWSGFGLLLVGFGFKISSVPFHMWAPDVVRGRADLDHRPHRHRLQGGRLRRAHPRAGRGAAQASSRTGRCCMWGMAALTMTVGNVVALAQSNLKRMLAYSSIAHVGYMLVGAGGGRRPGRRRRALLPARLHLHHDRAPSASIAALRARRATRRWRSATTPGSPRRHPVLAADADALPALAGRHPARWRASWQVLPLRRRRARRLRVAGRDRRAELRHRRLLLPARRSSTCTCASPRARPP